MPAAKRSHRDAFAHLEEQIPADYDPEDDATYSSSDPGFNSDDNSDDGQEGRRKSQSAREHYVKSEKSALRQREAQALGPQYAGSRISRKTMRAQEEEEEHDPFGQDYSSETSSAGEEDPSEDESSEMEDGDIASQEDTDASSFDNDEDEEEETSEQDQDDMSDTSNSDTNSDTNHTSSKRPSSTKNKDKYNRSELRQLMANEQKNLSANLSAAHTAEVKKGTAIKRQQKIYDALLNTTIRLRPALVASNSLLFDETTIANTETSTNSQSNDNRVPPSNPEPEHEPKKWSKETSEAWNQAYNACISLWNDLDTLRHPSHPPSSSSSSSKPQNPATPTTPLSTLYARTTPKPPLSDPSISSTLKKWSNRTASLSTSASTLNQPNSANTLLDSKTAQPTIYDLLTTQHLSTQNVSRLVARTRIPRSCAPIQAARGVKSDDKVYDDTDFYTQLIKDLIDSRNVAGSLSVLGLGNSNGNGNGGGTSGGEKDGGGGADESPEAVYRAIQRSAKVKRNVDVKATKGRKLKYTVHEKLQNLMAPQDMGSWGERQRDELFAGLFGQKRVRDLGANGGLDDGNGREESSDEDVAEEEALMLFRNG